MKIWTILLINTDWNTIVLKICSLIGEIKVKNVKWIFFDVGSTLVDESKVYEDRMRKVAIRHLELRSD
jgi:hypothetical protein